MANFTTTAYLDTGYINGNWRSDAAGTTASQGWYADTYPNRIGLIDFSGIKNVVAGKNITSITINVTCGSTGGAIEKTVRFYKTPSNLQEISRSNYATAYLPGYNNASVLAQSFLGEDKQTFYNNSTTLNITGEFYTNLKQYLEEGNNLVAIFYQNDAELGSNGYSQNLVAFTSVEISVEYDAEINVGSSSIFWVYDGTSWRRTQEASASTSAIPPFTAADEGKFLRIVNGTLAWVSIPNAEEASF